MKSILTSLLTVLLIPINANAAETPPNMAYLIEVCTKAYPQDSKAAGQCSMKAAGFDPDAPPPTREELVSLYGGLDDPKHVEEIYGHWDKEMRTHQSSYRACIGEGQLIGRFKCLLEAADQELAIHEHLFESLKPPAWPSSAGTRYAITHALRATMRAFIGCESLASAEKETCMKKIDEKNDLLLEGRIAYLEKGLEQVGRHLAARDRKIRSRDQQLRAEESRSQREHELELARIQALGMFFGSGGFRGMREPISPMYQPQPVRPPVNCTTNMIGSSAYTNCY